MGSAVKSLNDWEVLIDEVCTTLHKQTGNVLDEKQRPMVESRMKKRLLDLKLSTPLEYRSYWESCKEAENKHLIGLLTTHFTSFFREFGQFEWLATELPHLVSTAKKEKRKTLKFWSSACSKGQEVWSLCMWLQAHLPKIDPTIEWMVYGSDIDENSVEEGKNAVYHRRELETAPRHLWEGQWVSGSGEIAEWYKAKKDLRNHAKFMSLNLLDLKMPASEVFDVIMCRNVLIYFDRSNQEKAVSGLLKYLHPAGTLITGVSESLNGYGLPLRGVAPSIYKSNKTPLDSESSRNTKVNQVLIPKPLKVLCVDDSPTVLSILKKVLSHSDFLVVGTAANGQEAMEKFNQLKPDVITLDLHMPVMDGTTFLKTSGIAKNIPVIVVSSVGRDDSSIVRPLFDLGICDFVEKPTMSDLEKTGEELRQKLKMSWTAKNKNMVSNSSPSIAAKTRRTVGHIILNFGPDDIDKVLHVIKAQDWLDNEISFCLDGSINRLNELKENVSPYLRNAKRVKFYQNGEQVMESERNTVWLHFSTGSKELIFSQKKKSHCLLIEESTIGSAFKNSGDDIVPFTSFSYNANKFLGGN